MRHVRRLFVLSLLSLLPIPAPAQFVFLDANRDGVNDPSDRLNPTGSTDLDVWFVTNEHRDGSAAVCATDPAQPLTINSYEVVLEAIGGSVEFGPMENRLPFSGTPVSFATYEDTTSTTLYHQGWGYRDIFPPGRYLVATLRVRVLEGDPSLVFRGRSPVQPTDMTSFGTACAGADFDNTYVLGEEFFDALGIGDPVAVAGGPYRGTVGREIRLDGRGSNDPDGDPLGFQWTFDDGGAASGPVVTHTWGTVGLHHATLTVQSASGSNSDTADVHVVPPGLPVADAGGPYVGRPGIPVPFDGSASFDPDGDPLEFVWTLGTGARVSGAYPHYAYTDPGVYAVTLRVSDGVNADIDETTATIAEPVNATPVADAGGPYEGIAGRWIQFGATRSHDPDGDFLHFQWDFGDGINGTGIVTAHAYREAGVYQVTLAAGDGIATGYATTTAAIGPAFAARAFFEGGPGPISLDESNDDLVVRFEPLAGSFQSNDVDLDLVTMIVTTVTGERVAIPTTLPALEHGDSDGNGVPEFVALFARERFRDLAAAGRIRGLTRMELTGELYRGGAYAAGLEKTFIHGGSLALRISPNPFNPQARLTIHVRTEGDVSAALYDVRGRRVRHVLRHERMRVGRHDLLLDARDDGGERLGSGVYFLRVTSQDGSIVGRVVVAK